MAYTSAILYFLSGTGNTYRLATWTADVAEKAGIPTTLTPIETAQPEHEIAEGDGHLVGLFLPAHGFTAPWAMIRFALRIPHRNGDHVFVACTRGGTKLFGIRLPGMEGTAGYLPALILMLKGYDVRGVRGFDMPSNWTSLHSGFKAETVEEIMAHARPKAERFIATILAGQKTFGSFVSLAIGLLLLPLSAMYLILGRFFLAKLFFANSDCDGCGLCARICPNRAVRMWGDRPYWTFSCESCMRCMAYCPKQAIEAGHSWGALLYLMATIPVSVYLLNWAIGANPSLSVLDNRVVRWLIEYPYRLTTIFVAYVVFTWLIRIPVFNALFTYTTLTHFYRRYHAPETKVRDLEGAK